MNSNTIEDKRRFTRIVFSAPAKLCVADLCFDTKVVDVSLKGALVEKIDDAAVHIDRPCTLQFCLNDSDIEINLEGRIVHSEQDYLGINCEKIDIQSVSHLRRLVELNVGNWDLLERNLDSLLERDIS